MNPVPPIASITNGGLSRASFARQVDVVRECGWVGAGKEKIWKTLVFSRASPTEIIFPSSQKTIMGAIAHPPSLSPSNL